MHRLQALPLGRKKAAARVLFLLALALAPSAPGLAADGVVEINAASAAVGGITGADTPGYPVTIAAPGSYRLTGDLRLVGAQEAIRVTADDVTLDLGGFVISCRTPTIPSVPCSNFPGSQSGVLVNGDNVVVRDGTIRGMPANGVFAGFDSTYSLTGLRVVDNGTNGLHAIASRGEIRHSLFRGNGANGLLFEDADSFHSYSLEGVRVMDNGADGLRASTRSAGRITHSHFEGNAVLGMRFEGFCQALVSHTITKDNGPPLTPLGGLSANLDCRVGVDKMLAYDGLGTVGVVVLGCSQVFTPTGGFGLWSTRCPQ